MATYQADSRTAPFFHTKVAKKCQTNKDDMLAFPLWFPNIMLLLIKERDKLRKNEWWWHCYSKILYDCIHFEWVYLVELGMWQFVASSNNARMRQCFRASLLLKNTKKNWPSESQYSTVIWQGAVFCLKGIVSRDFEWLQMILMNRSCVPDVLLKVYSFLNFFRFKVLSGLSFY